MTHRRAFLQTGMAGLALSAAGGRAAFSQAAAPGKLVLVILRGAMDGLAAVPPIGEPQYRALRGALALAEPGAPDGALALDNRFALHPGLAGLHRAWTEGQLVIEHATASAYRERSHFDGQDALESAAGPGMRAESGWLSRVLGLMPAGEGVAIGRTVPLALRGPGRATSWSPAGMTEAGSDTLIRLMDLYQDDTLLGPALAMALETRRIALGGDEAEPAGGSMGGRQGRAGGAAANAWADLARSAARLLTAPGGPAACVLSLDGWDTHANQGAARGALAVRLAGLDGALSALRAGLGADWTRTRVIVATEFGRTVAVNGTGGTDHGTGGAAFVLGGGLGGSSMSGDWPGLSRLHEGRDLVPANDVRRLFARHAAAVWRLDPDETLRRVLSA